MQPAAGRLSDDVAAAEPGGTGGSSQLPYWRQSRWAAMVVLTRGRCLLLHCVRLHQGAHHCACVLAGVRANGVFESVCEGCEIAYGMAARAERLSLGLEPSGTVGHTAREAAA